MPHDGLVAWFETLGIADVPLVGGKYASLGKMTRALAGAGVRVPGAAWPRPRRARTWRAPVSGTARTRAAPPPYRPERPAGGEGAMGARKLSGQGRGGRGRAQDAQWGGAEHDDALPGGAFAQLTTDYAGRARVKAREGRRIQVVALAVAAVESLGRRRSGRAEAKPTGEGMDRE